MLISSSATTSSCAMGRVESCEVQRSEGWGSACVADAQSTVQGNEETVW